MRYYDPFEPLAKLKERVTDDVVKEIAARLQDGDPAVCTAALYALAGFKEKVTDEMVREIAARLRDEKKYVCEVTLLALAELKERVTDEMAKEIAAWLTDDNRKVRVDTYRTLKIFYESGITLPLEKNVRILNYLFFWRLGSRY